MGRSALALATVVATFRIVFLFLSVQRYFSSGRTAGALVGEWTTTIHVTS